jgi:hypothetical protein
MHGELWPLPRALPVAAGRCALDRWQLPLRAGPGTAARRTRPVTGGWPQAGLAAREPTGPDQVLPASAEPWGLHLLPHVNPAS